MKKFIECLSFDDVLLVPQYSEVVPSEVDTSTMLGGVKLGIPILSAAMDTVTEAKMAIAMADAGGLGVIHKNLSPEDQAHQVKSLDRPVAIAVGVKDWEQRINENQLVKFIVIDSAHGHSKNALNAVTAIKKKLTLSSISSKIIAGNVVTPEAVYMLYCAGADIVKVGIGPGSICTTRLVSGCGVPQLTAIMQCAEEADKHGIPVIADGGIKCSGDIVKALAAGADAVMIGSMLAGTDEAPGDIVINEAGQKCKCYRGMGSIGAMEQGSKDRYGQSDVPKDKLVPEGVEAIVPHKGPVSKILHQLIGGLRSGMGYVGARNLYELRTKAKFIRVTNAGIRENGVHDVFI